MPRLRPAASLLAGFLFLASLSFLTTRLAAAFALPDLRADSQTPNDKLIFYSQRDGDWNIFTMNADGSEVTRLTDDPASDTVPVWSPDGKRITFSSNRDGNDEIYVMNSDGSNVMNLSRSALSDFNVSWSPDSQHIAFQEKQDWPITFVHIYSMSVDSRVKASLAPGLSRSTIPTWSPQGDQIAFQDAEGVYLIDVRHGMSVKLLDTSQAPTAYWIAWSPNGKYIAFVSGYRSGSNAGYLYLMNLEDFELKKLHGRTAAFVRPIWSPDSQQIVFSIDNGGNADIYSIHIDGSQLTNLTNSPEPDRYPDWSPDGKRIAFTRFVNRHYQIFVMDADGSNAVQVTTGDYDSTSPQWQP